MIRWTEARKARVEELWGMGHRRSSIASILTFEFGEEVTENAIQGLHTRMNLHAVPDPAGVSLPPAHHIALGRGRTLFPNSVVSAPVPTRRRVLNEGGHVLMSGANQAKLGAVVKKGPWRGMPIFSLSLEERATCPRSCANWRACYGNSMPLAKRFRHGPKLIDTLAFELVDLQKRFPGGFVVRLHLLGDFYSPQYVVNWALWLDALPALHVFGYTAWGPTTPIGSMLARLAEYHWDRFAVRLSSTEPGPRRAVTVWRTDGPMPGIVCPAQTGRTRSCASCGLCWAPAARDRTIAFIAHGPRKRSSQTPVVQH